MYKQKLKILKVRSLLKDLKTPFLNGEIQPKICQYGQH